MIIYEAKYKKYVTDLVTATTLYAISSGIFFLFFKLANSQDKYRYLITSVVVLIPAIISCFKLNKKSFHNKVISKIEIYSDKLVVLSKNSVNIYPFNEFSKIYRIFNKIKCDSHGFIPVSKFIWLTGYPHSEVSKHITQNFKKFQENN